MTAPLSLVNRQGRRYTFSMTDTPDLEQLARRYLDLWQEQTAAIITDPATAEAMGRAYALFGRGLAAFGETAARTGPATEGATETTDHADAASDRSSPAAAGSAPPADASAGTGPADGGLADRVARLEERILRLEAALGLDGEKPAKPARKRRS